MSANEESASRQRVAPWAPPLRWLDPRAWAYVAVAGRDKRLDLLRGCLVLIMVVDHIGGNSWFNALSGNNSFLISAAEGFVFLSGTLVGIVYGKRALRYGLRVGVEDLLKRAAFLYLVVTALTLISVGLFLFSEVPLYYDRTWGLGLEGSIEILIASLTLRFSYNGTDVLALYVLLIAASPLALFLLVTGRTPLLLAGSWALWAAYLFFPAGADLPWPVVNSTFPFSSWQALFFGGMVLGFHRERLGRLASTLSQAPVFLSIGAAALGIVLFARAYNTGEWEVLGLPAIATQHWQFVFGKMALGPGRLLTFAVFAAVAYVVVTRAWTPLQLAFGWLLLPFGQSALVAYGAHLFLIGPVQIIFLDTLWGAEANPLSASVVHMVALVTLLALVRLHALPSNAALAHGLGYVNRRVTEAVFSRRYEPVPCPHETEGRCR
jgi:hypothetical protein